MIKIGFNNVDQAKIDYPNLIADKIADRLKLLKTSLTHISVAPNRDDHNVTSFKVVTHKIINFFQPTNGKILAGNFNYATYNQTVSGYTADPVNQAKLTVLNFAGLIQLIDRLLGNQEKLLRLLLICSPDRLFKINDLLMRGHGIVSTADKFALGLAFDWKLHTEVTDQVKTFFHDERQVVHCPYCNINRAFYSELPGGQVSSSFSLDHFYTKTNYPLLTFCMFNLVPADDICNGSNIKGQIPFYYDYHLNPYEAGMDRTRMVFLPNIRKYGEDPTEIFLSLIPQTHERKYQQLVGNFPNIDETRIVGNINVFKLKKNYNEDFVLERAGGVQRRCESIFRTRYHLKGFLKTMNLKLDVNSYQRFYKDNLGTEFLPEKFHRYSYSKMVRDIHDNVLKRDRSTTYNDIKKLVSDNPA
ncbi:hypothetical protein AB6735_03755 [Mucilaginibacter sp. RCC_168]|uniref:hypothetical protein n=1 Tax=Mucilaginibacter sp. RCC_168 TaxID=3239221 RepID=UPI0035250BDA